MTKLFDIQKSFYDYLRGQPSDVEQYVIGKNDHEIKRRLNIYQEAYQLRLLENLRKQYPVLAKYLGEEKFNELAAQYNVDYPPKHYAIRRYGENLANFIQKIREQKRFLSQLAAFEWAMNEALDDSAEAVLYTQEDLQKLTQEALIEQRFHFHPSVHCLIFDADIPAFWQAIRKAQGKKMREPTAEECYYLVWRKDLIPYYQAVEKLEWELIQAAQKHANFADLCELAAQGLTEDAAALVTAQKIFGWIAQGWLVHKQEQST